MSTSACWRRSCSRACSTPCATRVSLDPLARNTAKPTTSWPSSLARVRASPAPSRRTAISSSRVQRPSGNAMGVAPSARTLAALPSARIDCSAPASGAAAGDVGVGAQQLRVDLVRAQPQRLQPVGAQGDPDFALHPAQALHLLHAGHGQQFPADHIVDEPRDVDQAPAWALTA